MKRNLLTLAVILMFALGVFFAGCETGQPDPNLLRIATETAGLESLVNMILYIDEYSSEDPNITGALAYDSPLTVFGPVNAAFVAVFGDLDGDGIVELEDFEAFRDANFAGDDEATADALLEVLAYHVIEQLLLAADVVAADGSSIGPTAAGEVLNVTVGANVNLAPGDGSSAANISATDVTATNGVAHTIDAIMGL